VNIMLMSFPSISSWKDQNSVSVDEFFIQPNESPDLYHKAHKLHQKYKKALENNDTTAKRFPEPVLQLSAKGLALLSHLYAQKDQSTKQPLVASTVGDFLHLLKLIQIAPPGIEVTVIFQPTDTKNLPAFYQSQVAPQHRTVIKFEKDENALRAINIDPVSNPFFYMMCQTLIVNTLKLGKEKTNLIYFKPKFIINPEDKNNFFSRQTDFYQCAIYAHRDARSLNKESNTSAMLYNTAMTKKKTDELEYVEFELPAKYLKGIHSKTYSAYVLTQHGQTVVTNKGKTLKQVHEQYLDSDGYAHKFSKRYQEWVKDYVEKTPGHEIKKKVALYDAANMTLESLIQIYGPQVTSDNMPLAVEPITNQFNTMKIETETKNKQSVSQLQENANLSKPKSFSPFQ